MPFSNCNLSGFEIIKLDSSANRIGVDKSDIAFGTSFMYSKYTVVNKYMDVTSR